MAAHSTSPQPRRTPLTAGGVVAALGLALIAFLAGRFSARMPAAISAGEERPARARAAKPDLEKGAHMESREVVPPADNENAAAPRVRGAEAAAAWIELSAQPGSVARDAAMAAAMETLAKSDAPRALALAHAERNLLLRDRLIHAALRGWAGAAPRDALHWAGAMENVERRGAAVATVFAAAAAARPDDAVRLGRETIQADAGGANGFGGAVVDGLCAAGHFERATRFAADAVEAGPMVRSILLTQAFSKWAMFQPERAGLAAAALPPGDARADALQAVVSGWGQADPAGLTVFIAQLGPGSAHVGMLGQSLRQWAAVDAAAATAWVAGDERIAGTDEGIAAVVGAGFLKPAEAAEWAQGIADRALRSQATLSLLRTWASTEPEEARGYFEKTPFLLEADRQRAAALFAPPGGP